MPATYLAEEWTFAGLGSRFRPRQCLQDLWRHFLVGGHEAWFHACRAGLGDPGTDCPGILRFLDDPGRCRGQAAVHWECARSPLSLDRLAESTGQAPGLLTDVARALRGLPLRPALGEVRVRVLMLLAGNVGATGQLILELVEDGTGQLHARAPERVTTAPGRWRRGVALLPADEDFRRSLGTARALAVREISWDPGLDIRWTVEPDDPDLPLTGLEGGSMGGALALGILQLLARYGREPRPSGGAP